jgi:tetratricopeptide (TPR) repeat protein
MKVPQDPIARIRQERERLKLTRGKLIRRARELLGLSQEELAQNINGAAITVSRWEREEGQGPNLFHQRHLVALFGLEVEELGYLQAGDEQARSKLWNVPFGRNPYFTGHAKDVEELHRRLVAEQDDIAIGTISGLGGIGKTQLMLEYAYRYREAYDSVFWLRADTQEILEEDLAEAAKLLRVPEARKRQPNHQYLVNEARQWLRKHSGWLLLLDNVEENVEVKDLLLEMPHGHVLLTTRSQAVAELATNLLLDKLPPEEGALLLLRRARPLSHSQPASPDTFSDAERLGAMELSLLLDGLPLALDQAGAYIGETSCGLSGYIQLYQTHRKELLARRSKREKLYTDYKESVATTWSISFGRVEQQCPAAVRLLNLCAFLHPDAIPEDILLESTFPANTKKRPIVDSALQLNQACEVLLRYSLIRRNAAANLFSIHRLVQTVLQDRMDEPAQRLWAELAMKAVEKAFSSAPPQQVEYYIPHARLCADLIKRWELAGAEATHLLERVASEVDRRGWYAQATPLYLRALGASTDLRGRDDHRTIHLLRELGRVHMDLGVYGMAALVYEQAKKECVRVLGAEHPAVVDCLNNLALAEMRGMHFANATRFCEQALAWHKRASGPVSAERATTYWIAAEIATVLGSGVLAEAYYRDALRIGKQMLGTESAEVANILSGLGMLCIHYGAFEHAEPLLRQALEVRQKVCGQDHPQTAHSLENLAVLARYQDNPVAAEQLCKQALAIRQQKLGPFQPDIARNLRALAALAGDQGKSDEAEQLYRQSLATYQYAGGMESPDCLLLLVDLADFLRKRGRVEEADAYERQVESTIKRIEEGGDILSYAISKDGTLDSSTHIWIRRRPGEPRP